MILSLQTGSPTLNFQSKNQPIDGSFIGGILKRFKIKQLHRSPLNGETLIEFLYTLTL